LASQRQKFTSLSPGVHGGSKPRQYFYTKIRFTTRGSEILGSEPGVNQLIDLHVDYAGSCARTHARSSSWCYCMQQHACRFMHAGSCMGRTIVQSPYVSPTVLMNKISKVSRYTHFLWLIMTAGGRTRRMRPLLGIRKVGKLVILSIHLADS
jgi:hypothetical protein